MIPNFGINFTGKKMTLRRNKIGILGEDLAVKYLLSNKYQILYRNYRTKVGEIDIITQKDNKISFVEVKTRVGLKKGYPYEAITKRKLNHLRAASTWFLLQNNYKNYKLSLDVVSVLLNEDETVKEIKFFEGVEL